MRLLRVRRLVLLVAMVAVGPLCAHVAAAQTVVGNDGAPGYGGAAGGDGQDVSSTTTTAPAADYSCSDFFVSGLGCRTIAVQATGGNGGSSQGGVAGRGGQAGVSVSISDPEPTDSTVSATSVRMAVPPVGRCRWVASPNPAPQAEPAQHRSTSRPRIPSSQP